MSVTLPLRMLREHVPAEFRDTNNNQNLDVGDVVVRNKIEFVVSDYNVVSFNHLDSFLERAVTGRVDLFPDATDPAKAELFVFRHPDRDVAVVEPDGFNLARYPRFREPDENRLNWTYQRKKRQCGDNWQCRNRVTELYRRVRESAQAYAAEHRDLEWTEKKFRSHSSVNANDVSTYLYAVDRYSDAESDYQRDLMWFEMG